MVGLVPVVAIVVACVYFGQKERDFDRAAQAKIIAAVIVVVGLSYAGLL